MTSERERGCPSKSLSSLLSGASRIVRSEGVGQPGKAIGWDGVGRVCTMYEE